MKIAPYRPRPKVMEYCDVCKKQTPHYRVSYKRKGAERSSRLECVPCGKEARLKWSSKHGDAYNKAWNAANPDKVKAKYLRYYWRHRDKLRAARRKADAERRLRDPEWAAASLKKLNDWKVAHAKVVVDALDSQPAHVG